jgi:REP element-mobilizing transposase RayT
MAKRALVPHRRRASHHPESAMHMTVRRREGLPSFRQQRVWKLLLELLEDKNDARFQIVEFSIQWNHIHLVVEADDRETVIRKMQGFMIAFAKRLNRLLGRKKGKVWADRYFARDIESSRDMHNVLSYIFSNGKKHGAIPNEERVIDLFSTVWRFFGYRMRGAEHWPRPKPRTAMLERWWRAHGPVRF